MSREGSGRKAPIAVGALLLLTSAASCDGILGLDIIDDAGTLSANTSLDGDVDTIQWDATVDASTVIDATSDGAVSDSATTGDAAIDSTETGVDCAAVLARVQSAPILPPYGWFGLDMSNGAPGGAAEGLSIDSAGVLGCASYLEPRNIEGGTSPILPGARCVMLDAEWAKIICYNVESRIIWQAQTTASTSATLEFHARVGGAYDDGGPDGGPSIYIIEPSLSPGSITRNGYAFSGNWSWPLEDAGESNARAWANEVYDGLMATYAPSTKAVANCLSEPFVQDESEPQRVSACSFRFEYGSLLFVVQPLALGLGISPSQNVFGEVYDSVDGVAEKFREGEPSCATPVAANERMDYSPIQISGNASSLLGPVWAGAQVGYLTPAEPVSNDAGMLATEADNLAGCNGVSVPAPDPGYSAEQWGAGEVELEYNPDSGVAYKVLVGEGYQGQLTVTSSVGDGGSLMGYTVGIGIMTAAGVPLMLDWSNTDGGLNATVTALSNGWFSSAGCSFVDSDCVQQGDCTIVPDDLDGHSTFTFAMSPAHAASCADPHPITFVFAQGTSVPSAIYVTNPGGAR